MAFTLLPEARVTNWPQSEDLRAFLANPMRTTDDLIRIGQAGLRTADLSARKLCRDGAVLVQR